MKLHSNELKMQYEAFISQKVKTKYLDKYKNIKILGENFMGNTYIVIFEHEKTKKIYTIIENIKNSNIINLNISINGSGYMIFYSKDLYNNIPQKVYKQLLKRGLFQTPKNRDSSTPVSLQRLIGCIYDNITGLSMHHIDKNKLNNSIENLVPLEQEYNSYIDSLGFDKMLKSGKIAQEKWFKSLNKPKKATLANNPNLQLEIIKKSENKKLKDVAKGFNNKIKAQRIISDILNFYFYKKEFLIWLKHNG